MKRLLAILIVAMSAAGAPMAISPRSTAPDATSNTTRPAVAVASNGRTFIVAWEDVAEASKVFYRTYDDLGEANQPVPLLAVNGSFPAVVWNGSEWVIAASHSLDIRAARAAEHGGANGNEIVVWSSHTPPLLATGIAANGSELMIGNGETVLTAPDLSSPRPFRFRVRPLAAAGGTYLTLDETNHVAIVTRSGLMLTDVLIDPRAAIAATANGSEYALVMATPDSVESMMLATDGTLRARQTLQINGAASHPAVTFSGGSYLAAWALPNQLCSERFTLTSINAVQCETRPSTPRAIALASGSANALLAWSETIAGTHTDSVFTRFYSSDAPAAIARQDVATSVTGMQTAPRIEKTADGFGVRWMEPSRLMSATLTSRGDVLAVAQTASVGSTVQTAHAAEGTLAVWSQDEQVLAQFIRDDGKWDEPFVVGDGTAPDVASDGEQWLVVWEAKSQIASTIVTRDRTVVATSGTLLAPSVSAQSHPAVASRGGDYLVAWSEQQAATQLMAIGVSSAGNANGGVLGLASTLGAIQQIQLAVSGRTYLIGAQNEANDVVSVVSDILVVSIAPDQPWRVRGYPGGFALLEGSPIRTRFIDLHGDIEQGGVLPLVANSFDFLFDGSRLVLAYEKPDGYLSTALFLESYAPRRRGVASGNST